MESSSNWLTGDDYNAVVERTKEFEGSAAFHSETANLSNLGSDWKTEVRNKKVSGTSDYGAYFDSRGYLTAGYGSLISMKKPGTTGYKKDIVNWINSHFDLENPVSMSTSGEELFSYILDMTEDEASQILSNIDLPKHMQEAKDLAKNKLSDESFNDLSVNEKKVITDMTYNMGKQIYSEFTEHWKGIDQRDAQKTAYEIQNSNYYNQVGDRADQNIQMILPSQQENQAEQVEEEEEAPTSTIEKAAASLQMQNAINGKKIDGYNLTEKKYTDIKNKFKDRPYSEFINELNKHVIKQ